MCKHNQKKLSRTLDQITVKIVLFSVMSFSLGWEENEGKMLNTEENVDV